MRFITITIISLLLSASSFAERAPVVTINQFVNHPALNAATKGIKTALKQNGIIAGRDQIIVDNAQGNIANAVQIAKHQASLSPKVMVGVATPSAQSQLKALPKNCTLGFVAVSDPSAAGLTGNEVLGVTDSPPIAELLDVLKKVMPNAKTIGVVYNPGEVNSVKTVEDLKTLCTERHINLEVAPINNTADVNMATNSLVNKIDVLYIPQDNTAVSAVDAIVKICMKAKIPVIANDPMLVKNKLLFALGTDYFRDGIQLGNMIAKHLRGIKNEPNIAPSSDKELVFNEQVAAKLGISIPITQKLNAGKL